LLLSLAVLPGARAQEAPREEVTVAPAEAAPGTSEYIPMTAHERWHGFLHESLLGTRPAALILGTAFLDHIGRAPRAWGLGVRGYAHRVQDRLGATVIDGGVHSSMAALLHQDTRYWQSPDHRPVRRVAHAFERTFFTRNDSGKTVFDISGIGGIYAGTMLPMYWHPARFSPLNQGVKAGDFGLMFQTASNLFKEFEPDLKRLVSKK
jgi:hypothetical protein